MRFVPSFVAVLMAGASLAACATTSPSGGAGEGAFDEARLMEHVRVLSDDSFEGRGIATEGETRTVDYLTQQYAAAGFEPGGENGGWTQAVTLRRFNVSNPTAKFVLNGQDRALEVGDDIVVSTRLPAQHQHLAGKDLVFVGYGITAPERNWDDFKDVDVRGKVIVVLVNDADFEQTELNTFGGKAMTYYGRWTYKYEEAARQGAAGVLIVHEDAPASYGWNTVRNSWSGPQFDIVRANPSAERVPLEAWITRPVAEELFEAAGQDFDALKVAARSRDFRPVVLEGAQLDAMFDVATSEIETQNVIARLPGSKYPDETILYTGHWDHIGVGEPDANGDAIFNGAVDNATGTAGLIEMARLFAEGPRPERSIVMISFTAEESGLLGSEFYAANPVWPLETTVAGFNMDAMNVYGRVTSLGIVGYGQSNLDGRLEAAAERQGREIEPDVNPAAGIYYRSDHFPLAKRGVPMAYAEGSGDFRDEPIAAREAAREEYGVSRYHQADDEWSPDWDLRGQIEDLQVFYWIGQDLANSRDWPAWSATSEFGPERAKSASARD